MGQRIFCFINSDVVRSSVCAFSLFLLASNISIGATRSITILGANDCQSWTKNFEKSKDKEDLAGIWLSLTDRYWLSGYVSGVNAMKQGKNILRDADTKTLYEWMNRYCKANPKSDAYEGADKLIIELEKLTR